MAEKLSLISRLLKRVKPESISNCYGFALSSVRGSPERYRDPDEIWNDFDLVGLLQEEGRDLHREIPFLKEGLPIIEDFSQAELIAVIDPYKCGGTVVTDRYPI